jgi:hypothetical protein
VSRPAWFILGGVLTFVVGWVAFAEALHQLDTDYGDPYKPRFE